MQVKFQFTEEEFSGLDTGPAKNVLSELEKALRMPDGVVTIKVVNEEAVQAINKKYADDNYPTDVLSFPYGEENDELGDVLVSFQHVNQQAQEADTPPTTELALLSMHGVLHVLGFDHQTQEEQEQMGQLQKQVMEAAGLEYRQFEWES